MKLAKAIWKEYFQLLELGQSHHVLLATLVRRSKQPRARLLFDLLHLQASTLDAIKELSLHGFDTQAKALHRFFLEISILGIGLIASEEFYNSFSHDDQHNDDEVIESIAKHWYRVYRQKEVWKVIQNSPKHIIPSRDKVLLQILPDQYEWLSIYNHGAALPIMLSNMTKSMNSNRFVRARRGRLDFKTPTTLSHLVLALATVTRINREMLTRTQLISSKDSRELALIHASESPFFDNLVVLAKYHYGGGSSDGVIGDA